VLTHEIFADLKAGKITREKAVDDLLLLAKRADDDDISLFDADSLFSYTQAGESAPLAYLLHSAVSNLVNDVQK